MKRSHGWILVLVVALVAMSGSVLADDNNFGFDPPEGLIENDGPVIRDLALKGPSEYGPVDPPPFLPVPPGADIRPLGHRGSFMEGQFSAVPAGGSSSSSSVQTPSGMRLDSYMNEHRVSKRKLKATIKKLG